MSDNPHNDLSSLHPDPQSYGELTLFNLHDYRSFLLIAYGYVSGVEGERSDQSQRGTRSRAFTARTDLSFSRELTGRTVTEQRCVVISSARIVGTALLATGFSVGCRNCQLVRELT